MTSNQGGVTIHPNHQRFVAMEFNTSQLEHSLKLMNSNNHSQAPLTQATSTLTRGHAPNRTQILEEYSQSTTNTTLLEGT